MTFATSLVLPLALVLALDGTAKAQRQQSWAPTGGWVVDFDDQQCLAGRDYQRGRSRVRFGVESRPMSPSLRMMLEVPVKSRDYNFTKASVFLGDEKQKEPRTVLSAPSRRPGHTIYYFDFDAAQVTRLKTVDRFRFSSLPLTVDLPLSDVPKLMGVLAYCVGDLLQGWGFGREQQARLATPPELYDKDQPIFRESDYPEAVTRGVGEVQARFTVHPDGRLSDCRIVRSSAHAIMDATTCSLILARAKFRPAMDRSGRPMQAPAFIVIDWLDLMSRR